MKKNIKLFGLLLMAGMAFTACSSDDAEEQASSQQENKKWSVTMDVSKGLDTRTLTLDGTSLNTGWSTDEKVYVFKSDVLVGTLSPTTASSTATASMSGTLEGNSWNAGDQVYLRFPREEVDYTGQDGTLETIAQKYDYAEVNASVKSVTGTKVVLFNAGLTTKQAIVKFTFPMNILMMSVYAPTMDEPIIVKPAAATKTVYAAIPLAQNNTAADYVVTTMGSDYQMYYMKKTGVKMANGKYYTCSATMTSRTWVDLGLSVNWCSHNAGTQYLNERGTQVAWGETAEKTEYTLDNYKWYNTSTQKYTKYVTASSFGTVDNRTTLLQSDDAAYKYLAGSHMPTKTEAEELNSSNVFSQRFYTGGNGYYVVTSKKSGYEGQAIIFLEGWSMWTSTLGTTTPYAYRFNVGGVLSSVRHTEWSVRPVKSK